MVLYFPVSALVTLFGTILQNPLDPRARSDTRLLSMVVTFLSALGQEVETGGVHRMLGICSEFERISKVMIDKAERENVGRRKRKNPDTSQSGKSGASTAKPAAASVISPAPSLTVQTPRAPTGHVVTPHQTLEHLSPPTRSDGADFSPLTANSHNSSPGQPPPGWSTDFSAADPMEFTSFAELTGFGQLDNGPAPPLQSPPGPGQTFQQPLIPPDLYSLPMSFDWDWAEMSGGAYPSVENGNFDGNR